MQNTSADLPLVTVGITTYNGARYLEQTLTSLVHQTYPRLEFIVSDDSSTDGTFTILRQFQEQDSRFHLQQNRNNLGIIANFNIPLTLAQGDYFFWASQDDLWEPTFVEEMVSALQCNPRCVLAFCYLDTIDEEGQFIKDFRAVEQLALEDDFARVRNYMSAEEYLGKPNLLHGVVRTEAARQAGPVGKYGTGLWFDTLYSLKLVSVGDMAFVPKVLFHKRLHDEATSVRSARLSRVKRKLQLLSDTHAYFAGCANVVRSMNNFSTLEQRSLLRMNRRRLHQSQRALLIQIATTPLRRAASLVRRLLRRPY